ncbi:hypothetical protein CEXT_616371 [Caerostris extrusa]|uniref:Uncharacterized protein n=1 Tax=Caerostris extrusa TaxID=172846 RepID=A0AAV4W618_CAEEX|nr:hypothetical protein CEXT_616371 [Caerostris extrusa]
MEDHCSLLPGEPFRNRRDKFHPGINKNSPHDTSTLLNPSPATMGYPTTSFSFSAVAVHYVRFIEPRPRLHGIGEVFSPQPKWKYKQNSRHDISTLLNPPPATMGYQPQAFSFSAVAVHYVRFTEPQPRLHGNGEVFSLQPKWK